MKDYWKDIVIHQHRSVNKVNDIQSKYSYIHILTDQVLIDHTQSLRSEK